jgi:hypothetical protein
MKELMLMSPLDDRAGEIVTAKVYQQELVEWAKEEYKGITWTLDKIRKLFLMAQNDEYPADDVPDEIVMVFERILSDLEYANELEADLDDNDEPEEDEPEIDEEELHREIECEKTQLVNSAQGIELGSFSKKFDLGSGMTQCVPRGEVTMQDWVGAFGFGLALESGAQWIIGDSVVALENAGHEDVVNQLCAQFKKSYSTVSGYARACRAFPFAKRDAMLPFTVYREIGNADLTEAKKASLLEKAKEEKLSSSEVRDRVKAEQGKGQQPIGHRYLCLNVGNTSNSEVLRHVPEKIEPHHLIIDLASKSWYDPAEEQWVPFLREK